MKDLEEVINDIKGNGKFQKRMLYMMLLPLYIFLALNSMMVFIVFQSPTHWCSHPMAENLTGEDLEAWKECFIPTDTDKKDGSLDMCKIVLPNEPLRWNRTQFQNKNLCPVKDIKLYGDNGNFITESCKTWSYDRKEFTRTIVTDLNWVCDNASIVPNLHSTATFGGLLGGLIYCFLGDQFGRKYVFWCVVGAYIGSLLIRIFFVNQFYVFVTFHAIASSAGLSIYQLPISIISEVSNEEFRSWAILLSWMSWTIGTCLLCFIGWLSGDWFVICLICALPMVAVFFGGKMIPESPRWLLSRTGRISESHKIFRTIAKVNHQPKPADLKNRLIDINSQILEEQKNTYGYFSLFTRWGLAIKTLLLSVTSCASAFTYASLAFNLGNMGGSTFLNLFVLTIVELPATGFGAMAAKYFGRRWTHAVLLLLNALVCGLASSIANHPPEDLLSMWTVNILCFIAKMVCTMSFYMWYLQAIELFPTAIRNSGMGFSNLMRDTLQIFAPQVTYLALVDKRIPYFIIAGINFVGAVVASFLPETLGCSLPETILASSEFGKEQKFWSWMWNPEQAKVTHEKEYQASTRRKSLRVRGSISKDQSSITANPPLVSSEA